MGHSNEDLGHSNEDLGHSTEEGLFTQSLLRICLKRQKKTNKHGQYIFIIVYNRI